jgi:hypothetical protein
MVSPQNVTLFTNWKYLRLMFTDIPHPTLTTDGATCSWKTAQCPPTSHCPCNMTLCGRDIARRLSPRVLTDLQIRHGCPANQQTRPPLDTS